MDDEIKIGNYVRIISGEDNGKEGMVIDTYFDGCRIENDGRQYIAYKHQLKKLYETIDDWWEANCNGGKDGHEQQRKNS